MAVSRKKPAKKSRPRTKTVADRPTAETGAKMPERLRPTGGPVTVPLAEDAPWIAGTDTGAGAKTHKPLRFYVVDDDPNMVEMMSALIEKAGHTVRTAMSSLTALAVSIRVVFLGKEFRNGGGQDVVLRPRLPRNRPGRTRKVAAPDRQRRDRSTKNTHGCETA